MSIRFALNYNDLMRGGTWENRSILLFYYEFFADLFKLVIYSLFFGIIVNYYGIPLHIIRDLYVTVRSFIIRVKEIIRYRKATANMNERYPEATEADLRETDRICIICREEMQTAKKLPCGHIFHFRCLRSWLERQQSCPTCRRSIFEFEVASESNANNRRDLPNHGQGAGARQDIVNQQNPRVDIVPEIHGEIVSGPFGNVPVVVIPPNQLAPFQDDQGDAGEGSAFSSNPNPNHPDGSKKSLYILRSVHFFAVA